MTATNTQRVAAYENYYLTRGRGECLVACDWRGIAFVVDATGGEDNWIPVPCTVHIEDPDEFRDYFGDCGLEAADAVIDSMPASLRDAIAEQVTEHMADYWEDSRLGI